MKLGVSLSLLIILQMEENMKPQSEELKALENKEWLESLEYVLREQGPERVKELLESLEVYAHESGVDLPFTANTPYINTIPVSEQPNFPGSRETERRLKSIVRWNAMAMVVKANRGESGIGGHISTYASAATLCDLFSGARFPRDLRKGIPGRQIVFGAFDQLPSGIKTRRRPFFVSAPIPHARFLGISNGFHGPWSNYGYLPGQIQKIPSGPGLART